MPVGVQPDALGLDALDLDDALNLEERHIREGFEDGQRRAKSAAAASLQLACCCCQPSAAQRRHRPRRAGRADGHAEGRELGLRTGFELGFELGTCRGAARAWRALQAADPSRLSARADKAVAALEALLEELPLDDPKVSRTGWLVMDL
jgi:hypothetical protein